MRRCFEVLNVLFSALEGGMMSGVGIASPRIVIPVSEMKIDERGL